jgi:DUF4097 and DUF4098 domain-containing protein YvlB
LFRITTDFESELFGPVDPRNLYSVQDMKIAFSVALILAAILPVSRSSRAAEFHDEIERSFALRQIGELNLTNLRGSISVQGWAHDRVRVRARRSTTASTEAEAKKLLAAADIRFHSSEGDIEVSAEYGKGLGIQDRLRERANPVTRMEIQVFAPFNLKLRVLGMSDRISVKSWNAPVEVRASSGAIDVEGIKGKSVTLQCPACAIRARRIQADLRCTGGSGAIQLDGVKASSVYAETASGPLQATSVEGEQLYVSRSGSMRVSDAEGEIAFQSATGAVEFREISGSISGRSTTGNITARVRSWEFHDKAFIESGRGRIELTLPHSFSGELDVWSRHGRADLRIPLQPSSEPIQGNTKRRLGRVGDGGELLRIFTEHGDIEIARGG